jgi:proline dehydrogenase
MGVYTVQVITRDFFLFLSKNKALNRAAQNWGGNIAAGKIIGGYDFPSSIRFIKELNEQGLSVTVDHLGEFVTSEAVAKERTEECIQTIEMIANEGLDSQVSLKMTSLGFDIDDQLVYENMTRILETAEKHKVMVTIDMEDEQRCQKTLDIFKDFKQRYAYISTVLQAYLYRTEKDINDLNQYKPFLRLVKGAYKESADVAFPEKADVDENYKRIIKMHLLNGNYTAIATHDDAIIDYTKKLVKEHNISQDAFEFQMLYGMRSTTQKELVKDGYKMRVYVPYGNDWYGYFMRRLAERPANIAFALKGMTKK